MRLGTAAYLTIFTPSPDATVRFLHAMGFVSVPGEGTEPLYDGALLYDVRRAERPGTALSYTVPDVATAAAMAENLEFAVTERSRHHAVIREPNGLSILVAGPEMMLLPEPPERFTPRCGSFAELSIETDDIERTVRWWQNAGFKATTRKETWCTLDDGRILIGAYRRGTCPHLFRTPSVTFFAPDMKERIASLKSSGLTFAQEEKEIGMEGHAVAESPDGLLFFLFAA